MGRNQITISLPERYEGLFEHIRNTAPELIDASDASIIQNALKRYALEYGYDINQLRREAED